LVDGVAGTFEPGGNFHAPEKTEAREPRAGTGRAIRKSRTFSRMSDFCMYCNVRCSLHTSTRSLGTARRRSRATASRDSSDTGCRPQLGIRDRPGNDTPSAKPGEGVRQMSNGGHRSDLRGESELLLAIAAARLFDFSMPKGQLPPRERFVCLHYRLYGHLLMLTLCAH
jgi:hypothetical protein